MSKVETPDYLRKIGRIIYPNFEAYDKDQAEKDKLIQGVYSRENNFLINLFSEFPPPLSETKRARFDFDLPEWLVDDVSPILPQVRELLGGPGNPVEVSFAHSMNGSWNIMDFVLRNPKTRASVDFHIAKTEEKEAVQIRNLRLIDPSFHDHWISFHNRQLATIHAAMLIRAMSPALDKIASEAVREAPTESTIVS